jgi:hypothetical protein
MTTRTRRGVTLVANPSSEGAASATPLITTVSSPIPATSRSSRSPTSTPKNTLSTVQQDIAPSSFEIIEGLEPEDRTLIRTLNTLGQQVIVSVPSTDMPSMRDIARFQTELPSEEALESRVSTILSTLAAPLLTAGGNTGELIVSGHATECENGLCISTPEERIVYSSGVASGNYGRTKGNVLPAPIISLQSIRSNPAAAEDASIRSNLSIENLSQKEAKRVYRTTHDLTSRASLAAETLKNELDADFYALGKTLNTMREKDLSFRSIPVTPESTRDRARNYKEMSQATHQFARLVGVSMEFLEIHELLEKILSKLNMISQARSDLVSP